MVVRVHRREGNQAAVKVTFSGSAPHFLEGGPRARFRKPPLYPALGHGRVAIATA
jgi:hypothetical protein